MSMSECVACLQMKTYTDSGGSFDGNKIRIPSSIGLLILQHFFLMRFIFRYLVVLDSPWLLGWRVVKEGWVDSLCFRAFLHNKKKTPVQVHGVTRVTSN